MQNYGVEYSYKITENGYMEVKADSPGEAEDLAYADLLRNLDGDAHDIQIEMVMVLT